MKSLIMLLLCISTGVINGFAQDSHTNDTILNVSVTPASPPLIKTEDVTNYIGSKVIIYDTVFSYIIDDDATITLNVGADFPDHLLTVILKGRGYKLDFKKIIGQKIAFQGTVFLKNKKPYMIISKPGQILGYKKYSK
jgi:hypothetical protein